VEGVTAISNYISTQDKTIGGRTVPSGSWIKELMITNPDIIEMVKSNEVNGVSPNFRLHENSTCLKELRGIDGNLFFNKDIENKECMKPVYLSLVDEPANEYGLEVFSYDKYLEKTKNPKIGGRNMANKFKEMLKGFGESIVNYADELDEPQESEKIELSKAEDPSESPEESVPEESEEKPEEEGLEIEKVIEELNLKIDDLTKRLEALENSEPEESEPEEKSAKTEEAPAEAQKSKQPKIKINESKLDGVELEKQSTDKVNHLGFPIKTTKELAKSRNSFNF